VVINQWRIFQLCAIERFLSLKPTEGGGGYRVVVGWNEKNKELCAGVFSPVRMKRVFKMKRMFSLFVFYATAALSIITL
jgi:hypothetical protein